MDILSLSKISGDSELLSFVYRDNLLTIHLHCDELDQEYKININTNNVITDLPSHRSKNLYSNCRIEIEKLPDVLDTNNNYYVPPQDFGQLMNVSKKHLNYAFGKKAQDYKYLFSLIGYSRLLTCVVRNLNDIICDPL